MSSSFNVLFLANEYVVLNFLIEQFERLSLKLRISVR
jgi:hypothetical protein